MMLRLFSCFCLAAIGLVPAASANEPVSLSDLGLGGMEMVDSSVANEVRGQGFATPGMARWAISYHQTAYPRSLYGHSFAGFGRHISGYRPWWGYGYSHARPWGSHHGPSVFSLGQWYQSSISEFGKIKSGFGGHHGQPTLHRPSHFWNPIIGSGASIDINYSSHVELSISIR